jgi:hypothetical protein
MEIIEPTDCRPTPKSFNGYAAILWSRGVFADNDRILKNERIISIWAEASGMGACGGGVIAVNGLGGR